MFFSCSLRIHLMLIQCLSLWKYFLIILTNRYRYVTDKHWVSIYISEDFRKIKYVDSQPFFLQCSFSIFLYSKQHHMFNQFFLNKKKYLCKVLYFLNYMHIHYFYLLFKYYSNHRCILFINTVHSYIKKCFLGLN